MSNPEHIDPEMPRRVKIRRFGQGTLHKVFDRMIKEPQHQPSQIQQEQEQQVQEMENLDGEA